MTKERFEQAVAANGMTMAIILFFYMIPEESKKEIISEQWQAAHGKGVLSNEDADIVTGILREIVRCSQTPKDWIYVFRLGTEQDKVVARQHLEEVSDTAFWETTLREQDQFLGNKELLALAKEKVRQAYAAE